MPNVFGASRNQDGYCMTFAKDPDATLDYSIDWTRWLDGDTISESQWIVPSGVTSESEEHTTTVATTWLSGGQAGERYTVTNRIRTLAGRKEDRSVTIAVQER